MEALASEIAQAKAEASEATAAQGAADAAAGRRASATAQNTAGAEAALEGLRNDLLAAERELDAEDSAAVVSASEAQELEALQTALASHLAARESELHALQRRALRRQPPPTALLEANGISTGESGDASNGEDAEAAGLLVQLQTAEARTAGARLREVELQSELSAALAMRRCQPNGVTGHDQEIVAAAAWRRARELAAELGEAQAALARRRATETSLVGPTGNGGGGGGDIPGGGVVGALRAALQDAEVREARSCAELAEATDSVAAGKAEQNELRRRLVLAEEAGAAFGAADGPRPVAGACGGADVDEDPLLAAGPAPKRLDGLQAKASALAEEARVQSRMAASAEARVRDVEMAMAQGQSAEFRRQATADRRATDALLAAAAAAASSPSASSRQPLSGLSASPTTVVR